MDQALADFHSEFYQETLTHADAVGAFAEDSFFDVFTEHLIAAGEIETADRCLFKGARGIRVDGYGGDPRQAENTLTLLVVDFNQDEEVSTLTATDLKAINNRAKNFLTKALDNDFRLSLEEATPAFGLADLINATWETTVKVRIILMSNRLLSARVDGVPAGELDGVPITYNVWDLGRLQRYVGAGSENEEIDVGLTSVTLSRFRGEHGADLRRCRSGTVV